MVLWGRWCYGDNCVNGDNGVGDGDMTMAIVVMKLVTMILPMMRKSVSVSAGGAVAVAT